MIGKNENIENLKKRRDALRELADAIDELIKLHETTATEGTEDVEGKCYAILGKVLVKTQELAELS